MSDNIITGSMPTGPFRLVSGGNAVLSRRDFAVEVATAGADRTATLPNINTMRNRWFMLKVAPGSAENVTVTPDPANTIDGEADLTLNLSLGLSCILLYAPGTGVDWKIGPATQGGSEAGGVYLSDVEKVFGDSPYTSLPTDEVIRWTTTGGDCVQALPPIADVRGQVLEITKETTDAHLVTINPDGAETIEGQTTKVLGVRSSIRIFAPLSGTDWAIQGGFGITEPLGLPRSVAGNAVLTVDDALVSVATGGSDRTATLPDIATCRGQSFIVIVTAGSIEKVTVTPQGGQTINGGPDQELSIATGKYKAAMFIAPATGTDWFLGPASLVP